LIFRLSDAELNEALFGPPVELAATGEEADG
jgi:hypothetical protein